MLYSEFNKNQATQYFSTKEFPEEIKLSEFMKKTKIPYGDAQRVLVQYGYEEVSTGAFKKSPIIEN